MSIYIKILHEIIKAIQYCFWYEISNNQVQYNNMMKLAEQEAEWNNHIHTTPPITRKLIPFDQSIRNEQPCKEIEGSLIDSQREDQENDTVTDGKEVSQNVVEGDGSLEKEDAESISVEVQKRAKNKKCFNALCKNFKIYKRIKSRIETSKYRSLCKTCHGNYINNQFCEFCEQIYDNTVNEDDDLNWIGCDTCQRWNHISCEEAQRLANASQIKQDNGRYECVACTTKARHKTEAKRSRQNKDYQDPLYAYQRGKKKTSRQVVNEERNLVYINERKNYINIFNRPREHMPILEQLLHNLNYKLAISDDQIKEDLLRFRTSLNTLKVAEQISEDDEEKKKRRKK